MKSRGNLIARLDDGDTCEVLGKFAHDLQKTKEMRKIVPFSGMSIALGDWNERRWCLNSSRRELVEVCDDVLNQVNWKHLSLRLYSGWEQHITCPSFRLVKTILRLDLSALQELSLSLQSVQRENIEEVLQKGRFPRLTTLRFLDSDRKSTLEDYTRLIKALVSTGPNLQVLYTEDRVDLSANLLEGSSATHVTNYPVYAVLRDIPESVIGQLRVQRLQLTSLMEDCNLERFNRMTPVLLESSRTTLSWMSIEIMFLIPLTCYGICLESVKDLEINLHYGWLCHFQPLVLRLVKSFNFSRIFPNLSTISITFNAHQQRFGTIANALNDMVDEGNPAFRIVPGRAINIKKISLINLDTALYCCAPYLAQMFPDIQTLSIEWPILPFTLIWDSWVDFKELEVILCSSHLRSMELDEGFCGIFSEEVAQLREKDEDYLRAMNIVPVRPSIVCFKGLRTFKLVCKAGRRRIPHYDPNYSLSKVSGLIAFHRCPDLTVIVATNDKELEQALSVMKPYAAVVPF